VEASSISDESGEDEAKDAEEEVDNLLKPAKSIPAASSILLNAAAATTSTAQALRPPFSKQPVELSSVKTDALKPTNVQSALKLAQDISKLKDSALPGRSRKSDPGMLNSLNCTT